MIARAISLAACSTLPLAIGLAAPAPAVATYEFGLSLATGVSNQLYSLFVVKVFEGQMVSADPISASDFILQAQGLKPSKANLEGRNLFLESKINTCLAFEDTAAVEYLYRCDALADLWKLRFQEYPFLQSQGQHPGAGWAETRQAPSPRQMMLLADYGILHLTGLCRGKDVFRLLHDMGDEDWVRNYRAGA
jgi:hypothetical protein